tara:strand:- start:450 stop:971 length:522 start_codon:yes stop_codon:yes gene_type:complete
MVVRYDPGYDHNNNPFDLELVDYTTPNNNDPILGKLSSLIQWHHDDPVDDFEINRNEIIYGYQQNRNPFIDHPNLVNFLWGDNYGEEWNESLSINQVSGKDEFFIYPNPTDGDIFFNVEMNKATIEIYTNNGQIVYNLKNLKSEKISLDLPRGVYFARIFIDNRIVNRKILIK